GTHDGRVAGRGRSVRGARSDGGGKAACAGKAVPVVAGGAVVDSEPARGHWRAGCVEGAVSWVEHYDFPRGAVYGHSVPVVGGDEEVEVKDYRKG
ncbi:hypothetical protein V490_00727, partial [Pseudogymnoascus sp. VKM F-3557]